MRASLDEKIETGRVYLDGSEIIGGFEIGDIVKGSVTRDPDGFPLLYSGSRADFHVLAMDRDSGRADWTWTARELSNRLRAYTPWPGLAA